LQARQEDLSESAKACVARLEGEVLNDFIERR